MYILGAKIDDLSIDEALNRVERFLKSSTGCGWIVTPNPEICLHATKDDHYRRYVLDQAFLALPDGFGLKIGAWILGEQLRHRVTGVDFTQALMKRAAERGWRVFLLGGKDVADRCAKVFMERYEGLEIVGTFDGEIANNQIIETINHARPDILLVAFGAPKQEKWIAENLSNLPSVRLAIGVGGTFDFIAGKVKRAPKILRRAGLEWLWRLMLQPRRLPRIYNATIKFLYTVIKWRLRMWFIYRPNVVGLITKNGKILLVERADEPGHWQLPQGGIDKGENAREAFLREMKEEIGIDTFSIISHIPRFFRYKWPKDNQLMQGYRGQRQDLFIAEFAGKDESLRLDQEELAAYRWVSREDAVSAAHTVRKEQVVRALSFLH